MQRRTRSSPWQRRLSANGIAPHEVLAVGDMPNDLPMLQWAGRSYAVSNAHPSVIAIADEVTGSNDEDAVAQLIEQLLQN